jgi:hypothetical protein
VKSDMAISKKYLWQGRFDLTRIQEGLWTCGTKRKKVIPLKQKKKNVET